MIAALEPDHLPRWLCERGHVNWSRDLDHCLHGGCGLPVVRVRADGRRYTPRSKRG